MGKPRDVMTLAHELGHGVHQVLAGGQGALMASTPLTLAETASVFGEMLTFRSLLERTKDKRERKAMLAQKAEDMINTVVRRLSLLPVRASCPYRTARGGTDCRTHRRNLVGCAARKPWRCSHLNPGYEIFWTYIPHFIHSPFYVYAYAFGDCLVNSLYAVYQNSEKGFQQKYFDMLKAGGTKHHKGIAGAIRP
jgi:oligoendopeptidase F